MTAEKYHSDHGKHRYEVVDQLKNSLTKFLYTELPIKVIMDCRTAATHTFRRRLGFKQYNITLTRKQLMLAKIESSFVGENMKHNIMSFVIGLIYIFMAVDSQLKLIKIVIVKAILTMK